MADRKEVDGAAAGEHRVLDFAGTPFEVGRQHGEQLRAELIAEAEPALAARVRGRGRNREYVLSEVVAAAEPHFRALAPRALEEIQGLAEGAGVPYPFAFFAAVRDGLAAVRQDGCTAFACGRSVTRDGQVLMGQTKDTSAPLTRYVVQRVAYASGEHLVLLNYPGWIGNICLTSQGLAFTGNSVYGPAPAGPTVPFSLLKRLVMEQGSVAAVLAAIKGLRFENLAMMIGDAGGTLVCLESAGGDLDVRDVSHLAFGHANSLLSAALRPRETPDVPRDSAIRQARIDELLAAQVGRLTVPALQNIVRDHAHAPCSICRHPYPGARCWTTAAYVANLTGRELHVAIGSPCLAPFRRYTLDW